MLGSEGLYLLADEGRCWGLVGPSEQSRRDDRERDEVFRQRHDCLCPRATRPASQPATSATLASGGSTPAFVLARVSRDPGDAWLPVSRKQSRSCEPAPIPARPGPRAQAVRRASAATLGRFASNRRRIPHQLPQDNTRSVDGLQMTLF